MRATRPYWSALSSRQKAELIAPLWREGLPTRVIGKRFGVTRNSVIGVAHRNRDLCPTYPPKRLRVVRAKPKKKRAPRRKVVKMQPVPSLTPVPVQDTSPPDHGPVHISVIGNRQCRWPVSEPEDGMFCGARTDVGESWCPEHIKQGYTPWARKVKEAA